MTTVLIDAPSNLGLRPPEPGTVPGCAKAPGALRDKGILAALGARDGGHLVAPRYNNSAWKAGDGVFHAEKIAQYSRALADRLGPVLDAGDFPLLLGGDCSILLGSGLALRRRGGRYGVAYLDGHSDFRHVGNSPHVGAAAGEDLALATGRGQADLTDLEGLGPLFPQDGVVILGIREDDEGTPEFDAESIAYRGAAAISELGATETALWTREHLDRLDGFWLHLDVDVLDPSVMVAVDCPDPGGLSPAELTDLLTGLLDGPGCVGMEVTIFDPDLDPDGVQAQLIVDVLTKALAPR